MKPSSHPAVLGLWIVLLLGLLSTVLVIVETKSFFSPIILVDKERGYIVISNSGKVFGIEVPPEARPHMDKLPISGMIDVVVEIRDNDQPPLIKRWKIAAGESSCKIFDGKDCR